jgi:hypothetical protein
MIFTINCPSCTSELSIVKKIIDAYKEKNQDSIKQVDIAQLTKLPNIDIQPIIEQTGIKSCCVAELISNVDRTLTVYGYNYM